MRFYTHKAMAHGYEEGFRNHQRQWTAIVAEPDVRSRRCAAIFKPLTLLAFDNAIWLSASLLMRRPNYASRP
jgi:hypothetical protein